MQVYIFIRLFLTNARLVREDSLLSNNKVRRIVKTFVVLLVFSKSVSSQGISNLWVMGYESISGPPFGGTNIDFIGGTPNITYLNRNMNFEETNAVICNVSGNLLFYSNGIYVADATGDTMQNGAGLNPGQFTDDHTYYGMPLPQGNIIIPFPADSNKYYLFHETAIYASNFTQPLELLFSEIDMNLNGGLGGLTSKNNSIIQDTLELGELIATKHANGRDWWLICHKAFSNKFYKLLITPYGVNVFSQDFGTVRSDYGGSSIFSSDGSKFAHYNTDTDIDIYDFDRCSGILSNYVNIPINDTAIFGGISFSPNNHILYAASTQYVYQFDITASNIQASMQTVAVYDGFYSPNPPLATTFFLCQLAPDGKIYINCTNSTLDIHVINYPDSIGIACNLQQHSIHLPTYNALTIANHPNYFLEALVGSPCDSLTPVQELVNNTILVRINPNPAQNSFYLNYELPYGRTAVATIYNTIGEVVIKKNLYWYFGYLQIDCSTLEPGIYFVKVETNEYGGSAKLVIAR
jgi:hypothetical protein